MNNIYLIISIMLIILGTIGVFLPVIPGPILVLLGIVIYSFITDFSIVSLNWIVIFSVLTLLTIIVDYLASFISAKRFNVSKCGIVGMFLGGFIGLFILSIAGLLIGQTIGLIIGELMTGKELSTSIKSGSAGLIGYLASLIIKLIIVGIMLSIFTYLVL
ncbi:MAG: DUF456 domain-containing protein [Clostridiaceae bacterium]|nr:DUF456 domain-containing protein [Clostridiaceae bacterium]